MIVREPVDNVYGHYKVLRRTDGLFVVLDITGPLGEDCPVFATEAEAREYAREKVEK